MNVYIFIIEILIFESLILCIPNEPQIFLLEDPVNVTLDSFESRYNGVNFNINTAGCVIPALNIQDVSINKYLHKPKSITKLCENYKHHLLGSNQTHIWIIKENYKHYRIKNESDLKCCYKSFHRPLSSRGIPQNIVDNRIQYLSCIMFRDFIEVNNEFVKIRCSYKKKSIYNQYFIFTPKKPFTFNRENPFKISDNQSAYNVIIMGLGSMSRLDLYRTMPKTIELLKKYNAIELKGYNTVAKDTFQNMIPILVGMNITELESTCWSHARTTLDNCPFIWERFKDLGYYTALVEDTGRFGMFNKGKFGFRNSPTDYYVHPFMYQTENLEKRRIHYSKMKNLRKILTMLLDNKEVNSALTCMGDKYYFEVLLNYIIRITTTLKKYKLFGLFWETSMSHGNLNDHLIVDNAYATLIKTLNRNGYLNDTILIFLSDHGMDNGDISLTKQARIEQRLPFVYILTPPSFRTKYKLAYHSLKVNEGRLTTPFDLHQTLIDLIGFTDITDKQILRRSTAFYTHNRGISLFLQISKNRTCEMAGISTMWCTCYNYVKLSTTNPIVLDAVNFLTNHVNQILLPYPECLKIFVDDIIVANEMVSVYDRSLEWRDFKVIVRTAPGGGVFETTMRLHGNYWIIVDGIKRLNFPGYQSLCTEDPEVKLFCFCY